MINEIVSVQDERWNKLINSFQYKDIYYTSEFFRVATIIDAGEPVLFYFENECGKAAYPFLKRKIAVSNGEEKWHDIVTPYGYGGPLFECSGDEVYLFSEFESVFNQYCKDQYIISEFIRFHPLLKGQNMIRKTLAIEHIRHTVYLHLQNHSGEFLNKIPSKTRNMIKKAMKNNITIKELDSKSSLKEFYEIYNETMARNDAAEYYYFSQQYFEQLISWLGSNLKMFGAYFEEKLISATLIMCYGDFIHYHLSGAKQEYLHTGVNNLLLYEIAKWGSENGYKYFHLGGGYKGDEDSLFKFKKSFTKEGVSTFCIGKAIHNEEIYWKLVKMNRSKTDSTFFPLYRSGSQDK